MPLEADSTTPLPSRNLYIQRVVELYRIMPGTRGHIRRADRQLAASLHDHGISIHIVSSAMLLAAVRRTCREGDPLPPICSLHYIRPLIEELLAQPPLPADYLAYLRRKLLPTAPTFAAATVPHQLP